MGLVGSSCCLIHNYYIDIKATCIMFVVGSGWIGHGALSQKVVVDKMMHVCDPSAAAASSSFFLIPLLTAGPMTDAQEGSLMGYYMSSQVKPFD